MGTFFETQCRVGNCCLSLYLHVAGDYDRVLERPRIYFGHHSGNRVLCGVEATPIAQLI